MIDLEHKLRPIGVIEWLIHRQRVRKHKVHLNRIFPIDGVRYYLKLLIRTNGELNDRDSGLV